MHPNEAPEESGGAGPSQPPEGPELEDQNETGSGSESGQTEAIDGDLVNAARDLYGVDATQQMRPITPIMDFTPELGWHVRLCQVPEIGRPLPAGTRDLRVAIA
eukprot:4789702-Pleurochrysis_carterae.AAC.1